MRQERSSTNPRECVTELTSFVQFIKALQDIFRGSIIASVCPREEGRNISLLASFSYRQNFAPMM